MPTKIRAGVICLLEFKRMSDVTSRYTLRAKRSAEAQYESLRSVLDITMQRQGWKIEQVSIIAGARSLNEEDLKKNVTYFEVPPASIEPIRTKLVMKIFDEYTNILKGMYSIRCLRKIRPRGHLDPPSSRKIRPRGHSSLTNESGICNLQYTSGTGKIINF